MKEIRKFTGLCPQYDVLVDNMTCREHLQLYAHLKCVEEEIIDSEVRADSADSADGADGADSADSADSADIGVCVGVDMQTPQ